MPQQCHEIGLPLEAEAGNTETNQREHAAKRHPQGSIKQEHLFLPPVAEIVFSEPLLGSKDLEISNDSKSSKASKKDDDSPLSSAISTASSALRIMRRESSADNFALLAAGTQTSSTTATMAAASPTLSQEGPSLRRKGFPSRRDRAHANAVLHDGRNGSSYGSLSSFNNSRASASAGESWRRTHPSPHQVIDSSMVYDIDYQRSVSMIRSQQHSSHMSGGGISSSLAPSRSSPRKVARNKPVYLYGKQEGFALRQNNVHMNASQQQQQHPANTNTSHSAQQFYHSSSVHTNECTNRSSYSSMRNGDPSVSRAGHFENNSPPTQYHFSHLNRTGGANLERRAPSSRGPFRTGHQPLVTTEPSSATSMDSKSVSARSSQTPPSSQTPLIENISIKSGLTVSSTSSVGRRHRFSNPDAVVSTNEEPQQHLYPSKESSNSTGDGGGETSGSVLVPPRKNRNTLVSFGTVQIRRYKRILGDNPSCSSGPALSLDWNHDDGLTTSAPVDDFEFYRGERLDDNEMVLTRFEREEILTDLGYSKKEIADAVRKNVNIKNQRRQTVNNLKVMPFEQAIQGAARKISRVVLRKSSSKSLYKNWLQEQSNVVRTPPTPIICEEESSSSMESQSNESPVRSSLKRSDVSFASSGVDLRSRDSTKGAFTSTTMTTTTHSAEYSMTMTAAVSMSNEDEQDRMDIHSRKESLARRLASTDSSSRFSDTALSGWTTDHVSTTEEQGGFESGLRSRCEASYPKLCDVSQSGSSRKSSRVRNEIIIMEQEEALASQ